MCFFKSSQPNFFKKLSKVGIVIVLTVQNRAKYVMPFDRILRICPINFSYADLKVFIYFVIGTDEAFSL